VPQWLLCSANDLPFAESIGSACNNSILFSLGIPSTRRTKY
jgi:hypothetical protein